MAFLTTEQLDNIGDETVSMRIAKSTTKDYQRYINNYLEYARHNAFNPNIPSIHLTKFIIRFITYIADGDNPKKVIFLLIIVRHC
jgi:hypothetical protein